MNQDDVCKLCGETLRGKAYTTVRVGDAKTTVYVCESCCRTVVKMSPWNS